MLNLDEKLDGVGDFWVGLPLPILPIPATNGKQITLASSVGYPIHNPVVVYCYPQMIMNDSSSNNLSLVPEAHRSMQQSCAFKDRFEEFKKLGITVYGLSTEDTEYQEEIVKKLGLPFALLSDSDFELSDILGLPKFQVNGKFFLKHLTFVVENSEVVKIFYPVTVPEKNAEDVLAWFENRDWPSEVEKRKRDMEVELSTDFVDKLQQTTESYLSTKV